MAKRFIDSSGVRGKPRIELKSETRKKCLHFQAFKRFISITDANGKTIYVSIKYIRNLRKWIEENYG